MSLANTKGNFCSNSVRDPCNVDKDANCGVGDHEVAACALLKSDRIMVLEDNGCILH